jgi:FKBP-type peptidyl-prolyl cis-trans isomerase
LAGVTFDSNVDPSFKHAEAFKFTLSQGQVIPGWDEGIAQLNKGAKATLYIPSSLAYGNQAAGDKIAPNSCLVFTVELVDFKAASASAAAPVQ